MPTKVTIRLLYNMGVRVCHCHEKYIITFVAERWISTSCVRTRVDSGHDRFIHPSAGAEKCGCRLVLRDTVKSVLRWPPTPQRVSFEPRCSLARAVLLPSLFDVFLFSLVVQKGAQRAVHEQLLIFVAFLQPLILVTYTSFLSFLS